VILLVRILLKDKGKPKKPRFDIIAINKQGKLCVIELKKGTAALTNTSGLKEHWDCYQESIGRNYKPFMNEMEKLLEQKQDFDLIDKQLKIKCPVPEFMFAYSYDGNSSEENQDKVFLKECNKIDTAIHVIKLAKGTSQINGLMKITIHRGIDQIGGCITEIATDKAKVLIDLGQNLPDGDGVVQDDLANVDSIEKLTKNIDAIFYTHYHGDHLGLFHLVPDGINQYIGKVAKRVALCKHQRLSYIKGREEISANEITKIENMQTFVAEQVIEVGDIRIIPYFVSHSAYDAYMFVIEANSKRILHTGDFRCHGYLGKGLLPTIKKLILKQGKIDFLITEGTMLSRLDERVRHENDLKIEVVETHEAIQKCICNVFIY
jgi:glyoxylase-like metal-dependent hydrolase (beta-lactamase superfamily II)